ncbi:MAG: signal recognition particle protein [Candidatus Fermentibacteraceae bacterium]
MFDTLTDRLSATFRRLRGRGKLTEKDVRDAMREIRRALLEADVNFRVAKRFVRDVAAEATGERVLGSLTPGQQVVKVVHDQLVELLGSSQSPPRLEGSPPVVYMLMGLQGSGKTTTAGRLARWLEKSHGKRSILLACDLRRPAAVDQLEKVASSAGAGFYGRREATDPRQLLQEGLRQARRDGWDAAIVDTSGRLHVDAELMEELRSMHRAADPAETMLVLDGLSGQDAVTVAEEFDAAVGYDGAVITKMDGDSRGGAVLSFKAVTGKPVRFVGTGEDMDGIELMDPDRMARRILGMGDVLGMVEKAQEAFDEKEAEELQKKLRSQTFTLEDFAGEIRRIRKMGSLGDLMAMLPRSMRPAADFDTSDMDRMEAIINSMTPDERGRPGIIDGSRRRRIAAGSGTRVSDVNRLLREFRTMKKMMKRMGKGMKMPAAGLPGMFR